MSDVGWGILATGKIARSFVADLEFVPGGRVVAVGSRSRERAERFTAEHAPGATAYGDYADLVSDPAVDVVYVATPHSLHPEHVDLALDAGKAVLCEKPVTLNARQAETMIGRARDAGLFFMEAMWTACHPMVRMLVDRFAAGDFGTPRQLHADLGWLVQSDASDRMVNLELGAGALLDMGIYPLTLAELVLGEPEDLHAVAHLVGGADHDIAIAARYAGGAVAALTASMTSFSPRNASIATSTGGIDIPADFHHPDRIVWTPGGGEPEELRAEEPLLGRGYGNEAAEVQHCLAAGLTESPLVPHARTLSLMRQMDALRSQIGVRYPGE